MSALHAVSLPDDNLPTPVAFAPIEPLFSMEVAAELIPFPSVSALYGWLHRNKELFPPRYQKTRARNGRGLQKPFRMLLHSEILLIRKMRLLEKSETQYANNGRPRGSGAKRRGPISSVIARAMRT